jgi:hypothetical protein
LSSLEHQIACKGNIALRGKTFLKRVLEMI